MIDIVKFFEYLKKYIICGDPFFRESLTSSFVVVVGLFILVGFLLNKAVLLLFSLIRILLYNHKLLFQIGFSFSYL